MRGAILWAVVASTVAVPARADEVDGRLRRKVDAAVHRAVVFVRQNQATNGDWRGEADLTAYSLYALLVSGVPATDATVRKALRWSEKNSWRFAPGWRRSTWATSLLVLALIEADPKRHRERIHELGDHLVRAQMPEGSWASNLVHDPVEHSRFGADPTVSTWRAAVALWSAATRAGYRVPPETWATLRSQLERRQQESGAWGPTPTRGPGSYQGLRARIWMTSLGLTTYALSAAATDRLSLLEACESEPGRRGAVFLSEHWPSDQAALRQAWCCGYRPLEQLECASSLCGLRSTGGSVRVARRLLGEQRRDGSWGPATEPTLRVARTNEVLLFLRRASARHVRNARGVVPSATLTRRRGAPRPEADLPAAFEAYLSLPPRRQGRVMYRFARAGLPGLRFLVDQLNADDLRARAAAFQLLGTLTVRPLKFDPRSPKESRRKQVRSIEQELESVWVHMDWDERLRRFVLPSRYPLPK